MPHTDYIAVSTGGAAYVFPAKPAVPNYAGVATAARDGLKDEYKEAMDKYNEAKALQKHFKAQMLQAIPKIYISELEDASIGYANVTPAAVLAHIMAEYGVITPKDLAANLENIKRAWDPKEPIQEVFTKGTKCRQFAIEGREPISDTAYVRDLITVFRKSGVLDKAVIDFEEKPPVDQTLDTCIVFFKSRDRVCRASALATKDTLEANRATQVANEAKQDTTKTKVGDNSLSGWCYCWSHGVNSSHSSKNCSNQRKATRRRPHSRNEWEEAPASGKESTPTPLATGTVKMKEPMPTAPGPETSETEGLLALTVVK